MPDVRMWLQDVTGVQSVARSFFAALVGSLYTDPGDVSWESSSSGHHGIFDAF